MDYKVEEQTTLMEFLVKVMPGSSRTKVKDVLAKSTYVNGRAVTQFNYELRPGMVVSINKPTQRQKFHSDWLEIVYEDRDILVINKREGILSYCPDDSEISAISELNRYLEFTFQRSRAHLVHRLDKETSGLMVYAKSKQVSLKFQEDWKGTVDDRAYVAVAHGRISPAVGTVRSYLLDSDRFVSSSPVDNGGKLAITHYEVVKASPDYSLVVLHLDTGRRNQIRVHLSEMGHPLVHDPIYGLKKDSSPIGRLCLHAFRIGFTHPVTGKRLTFETPFPPSFTKLLR